MELGRILLYSANELCRYVASKLKYNSACYPSSKLQWSGGIFRCLNGMDCYLPFLVVSVRLLMVSEHRWLTLLQIYLLVHVRPCGYNAYILCKQFTNLNIGTVKSFRTDLARSLIGEYCSRKRRGRPSLSMHPSKRFCASHFPVREGKRHRCHYCSNFRHERHTTVWVCNDCKLYLCHTGKENDCFLLYHKNYGPSMSN